MATAPSGMGGAELQEELEKKLAEISRKGEAEESQRLAAELGLPFSDLRGLPIDPSALAKVPEDQARAARVALVQTKGAIGVAVVVDPRTPAAVKTLEGLRRSHPQLKVVVISPADFETVLSRYATIKTVEVFE